MLAPGSERMALATGRFVLAHCVVAKMISPRTCELAPLRCRNVSTASKVLSMFADTDNVLGQPTTAYSYAAAPTTAYSYAGAPTTSYVTAAPQTSYVTAAPTTQYTQAAPVQVRRE